MVAFTEVICSLLLYPSTGGLGPADWWCLFGHLGLFTRSGSCGFGCSQTGLHLRHFQCSPDLPLRPAWPRMTLNSFSYVLLLEGQTLCPVWPSYSSRESEGVVKRKGQICVCVCVCVRLCQDIAYFSYPTLPLSSSGAEQLSSDCTPPVVSLFFKSFGQMVDYRSVQEAKCCHCYRTVHFWKLIHWLPRMLETLNIL